MIATPARPGRDRWIPWIFVLGFVVVVAVNGVLIVTALSSFSGLSDQAAYDHGTAYNLVLAEADRQEALGWRLAARLVDAAHGRGEIVVRATRADGAPLGGLRLTGELTRPVDAPANVDVTLAEAEAGVYRARVALPRIGQWDLHVIATAGADRVDLRQRIFAP